MDAKKAIECQKELKRQYDWVEGIAEACDIAIAALEKQIPKYAEPSDPLEEDMIRGGLFIPKGTSLTNECPECGKLTIVHNQYCPECGQALKREGKK